MSKKSKSKSYHETVEDDEPEAGWVEDTAPAAQEATVMEPQPHEDPDPVEPPPDINKVIADLQHGAAHNSAVSPYVIQDLQAIARSMGQQPGTPQMPVIDSLEPDTAPEGTLVLIVNGQHFTAESVICYGDVNQNTQVKTDTTQLTATFESGPPGSYVVLVHDPAGDSNEMTFVVT